MCLPTEDYLERFVACLSGISNFVVAELSNFREHLQVHAFLDKQSSFSGTPTEYGDAGDPRVWSAALLAPIQTLIAPTTPTDRLGRPTSATTTTTQPPAVAKLRPGTTGTPRTPFGAS